MVVLELLENDLGRVIVGDHLVLAGADAVGAPAPLVAGGLAGGLREDVGVVDAEVVDEGHHRVLEGEGKVGVILHSEALELVSLAVEHGLGAENHVVHIGGLGGRLGLEHALEGELDVVCRERGAVVAGDALLEGAVQGDAIILEHGDLGEQARDQLVVLGPAQRGLEDAVRDRGGSGVRGLLHVKAELGVRLAEAQNLLDGAVLVGGRGGVVASAAGKGRCGRGGSREGGTLHEAATGNLVAH